MDTSNNNLQYLLDMATRCIRLSRNISTPDVADMMLEAGLGYADQALQLGASPETVERIRGAR